MANEVYTDLENRDSRFDVIQDFMDANFEWQNKIFRDASPISCLKHLGKEVKETSTGIFHEHSRHEVETEFADCYILLLQAAKRYGMTFETLHQRAVDKMEINRARKWSEPNSDGVVEHIRSGSGEDEKCVHPYDHVQDWGNGHYRCNKCHKQIHW